jgi:hypothetical protein
MDWEMKARMLANDLRAAAWWLLAMSVWLVVEAEGWPVALAVAGVLAALNALGDARIEP